MNPKKKLSLKAKLILSQMAILIPDHSGSMCFFRDNADLFEQSGGVSLNQVSERYYLSLQTVYTHVQRLLSLSLIVKLRPGWYGLPSQLPDRELNLLLMEHEEYGDTQPM